MGGLCMKKTRERLSSFPIRYVPWVACVLGLFLAYLIGTRESGHQDTETGTKASSASTQKPASQPAPVKLPRLVGVLDALVKQLLAGTDAATATKLLNAASQSVAEAPRREATASIRALLDSGVDVGTGLAFKVGPGGNLATAPTLRVWLLDQFGRIDPAEAALYADHIYARHNSADEWALALRNDWRVSAQTGQIERVRARVLELLTDEAWASQPSLGFLEAFDLGVATLAWEAVPHWERWLGGGQSMALRGGAWIAIDRLAMEAPRDFLPLLAERSEWLDTQPKLRAGLFARADLANEEERRAVESYLRRATLSSAEGRRFFELIPNVSATVSNNLATAARPPNVQQTARMDQAALGWIVEWKTRADASRWNRDATAAEARLFENVASAKRGGILMP